MHKLSQLIRFIPKIFFALLALISKIILQALLLILTPLSNVVRKSLDKVRLSITLKLNLFYGFSYIVFFIVTYSVTLLVYLNFLEKRISRLDLFISLALFLGMIMFISFILFLFVGKLATKRILSSLKQMDETVRAIDVNQMGSRLNISGTNDELKDLARTFNDMMDKLELFINKQKQFVSDASHELRTPIAVIQGYANLLSRWGKDDPAVLDESIESIKQETENMKQLVENLLFLARADKNTQAVNLELLSLSDLAKEVLKQTSFIDDQHILVSHIEDNIQIYGDPSLTKELIRIFVDNAIKYTPEDGTIELIVRNSGKNTILAIKDTGIGISPHHLPHIFERFYRADEARTDKSSSSGLGLSIAKWIIDTHKAQVYVNSILGQGSEFIVFYDRV